MVIRSRLWTGKRKRGKYPSHWLGRVRFDFSYSRRVGYRLLAIAKLIGFGASRRASKPEEIDVPKKPASISAVKGVVRKILPVPKAYEKTPVLAGYLLDLDYEGDDGPREPGYYTVRPSAMGWQYTLKDPSTARQLRVTVADPAIAFATLEALLVSETCPWEVDSWAEKRKGS
jgi:hypothetical protein